MKPIPEYIREDVVDTLDIFIREMEIYVKERGYKEPELVAKIEGVIELKKFMRDNYGKKEYSKKAREEYFF